MKNYACVSREMAEKLRDAGYPQPSQYSAGYYRWYYRPEMKIIPELGFECYNVDAIYAPTATELLLDGWSVTNQGDSWAAHKFMSAEATFANENPHDAAAEAWLYVNKKQRT